MIFFIILSSVLVFLKAGGSEWRPGESVFTTVVPISHVIGERNGVDYYADLANSFLHGRVRLLGPYHPDLADHPNPYGGDAFQKGIVIQDASYYNKKYYLYFGPLPAVVYIAVHTVFGKFPTDKIVLICSFTLANALFVWYLFSFHLQDFKLRAIFPALAAYNIAIMNPLVVLHFSMHFTHSVSRLFSIAFAIAGFLLTYHGVNGVEKPRGKMLFFASLFLGCAFLCKFNHVLDATLIVGCTLAYLFLKSRLSLRATLAAIGPLAVLGLLVFLYNYIRFGSGFEAGVTYQTNSLDFVHSPTFAFASDPAYNIYLIIKRTYEYFLIPFDLSPAGRMAATPGAYPVVGSPRLYSEGLIGILCVVPVLAVCLYGILQRNKPIATIKSQLEADDAKYFTALLFGLIAVHHIQVVYMFLATWRYTLETLPYCAMLLIVRNDIVRDVYERYPYLFSGSILAGLSLVISI